MNRKYKKIISQNNPVEGIVTNMKKHGWIKINTKPVRTHSLNGALFPYTVFFILIFGQHFFVYNLTKD